MLKCDMTEKCECEITHIDHKGYIYCSTHGKNRKASGVNCRKLTSSEINTLKRGERVKKY